MNLDEAVAAARVKKPDVELLELSSGSGTLVFRVPGSAEANAFRQRSNDKVQRSGAAEALLRTCLVFPDADTFTQLVEKKPFLIEKWSDKLTDEAGVAETVVAKKL